MSLIQSAFSQLVLNGTILTDLSCRNELNGTMINFTVNRFCEEAKIVDQSMCICNDACLFGAINLPSTGQWPWPSNRLHTIRLPNIISRYTATRCCGHFYHRCCQSVTPFSLYRRLLSPPRYDDLLMIARR